MAADKDTLAAARAAALEKSRKQLSEWTKALEAGTMTSTVIPGAFSELVQTLNDLVASINSANVLAAKVADVGGKKGIIHGLYQFLAKKSLGTSKPPVSGDLAAISKQVDTLVKLLAKAGEVVASIPGYTEEAQIQIENHASLISQAMQRVKAREAKSTKKATAKAS